MQRHFLTDYFTEMVRSILRWTPYLTVNEGKVEYLNVWSGSPVSSSAVGSSESPGSVCL